MLHKFFQQSMRHAVTTTSESGVTQFAQYIKHPNFYRINSDGLNYALAATRSAEQIKACEPLFVHPKGYETFKNMGPVNNWLTGSPESIQANINDALEVPANHISKDLFSETIKGAGNAMQRSLKF